MNMQHRNRPFNLLLLTAFLVSLGSPLVTASAAGDQGSHWSQVQNRFSAFGVVESQNATTGDLSVTLEGTSRLLKDANGATQRFQVVDTVRVKTFGGAMGKGGMMPGGKHGHHGGRLTLADVQDKDNVIVTGSFDPATDTYNVKSIVIWLY
jgi:hypothetical protein